MFLRSNSEFLLIVHVISNFLLVPPRTTTTTTRRPNPCFPSPCGYNADCQNLNGVANCKCRPDYFGDPYIACERECNVNAECPINKACKNYHCIDPCPGLCGTNAVCKVINHIPTCTCTEGYIGDPFTTCRLQQICKIFLNTFHLFYLIKLYSYCSCRSR